MSGPAHPGPSASGPWRVFDALSREETKRGCRGMPGAVWRPVEEPYLNPHPETASSPSPTRERAGIEPGLWMRSQRPARGCAPPPEVHSWAARATRGQISQLCGQGSLPDAGGGAEED
ncbi:unnamed protein product [Gulo gulo]|uniref:Uncharacterized protein n=1 Tax=Gulo gulo TaxID=48420 RepID=A0A9X9LN08_GULGU|nr:unnamed protein product [Gulo gulo]